MRSTVMNRWMEAAEARRFRRMALQMPAQPTERRRLPLAVLMTRLQSIARLEFAWWRPARRATPSPE